MKEGYTSNHHGLEVPCLKLEAVHKELQNWGEIIITTASGEVYEIHLGDTEFDLEQRVITLKTPEAIYLIDGDSIENVKKHYGHRVSGDGD